MTKNSINLTTYLKNDLLNENLSSPANNLVSKDNKVKITTDNKYLILMILIKVKMKT